MVGKTSNKELYGIGAVAKATGLTDHTIRVWERRYAAVVAQRAVDLAGVRRGRRGAMAALAVDLGAACDGPLGLRVLGVPEGL